MAHNLGRAVGQLAGPDLERATAATLRTHHARPARAQRPETAPAPACVLALGRPSPARLDANHRHPAALLNNHPAATTRTSEKPADRRLLHAPSSTRAPPNDRRRSSSSTSGSPVGPG
jgi:hypothetical protein